MEKKGVKRVKGKRQRPEFTFEDGVELCKFAMKWCDRTNAIYVSEYFVTDLIIVLKRDPRTGVEIRGVIAEVVKFLRVTSEFQHTYENKDFRKKLKLYVKWLQSEMSKKENEMRKQVIHKNRYGEEFHTEVDALKAEIEKDIMLQIYDDRFLAKAVLDYVLNNLEKINKFVELDAGTVLEAP